ncbi:Retrovirus-related Pol polyprotein from transposon 17.6, partial [Mucuna pruriens]
MEVFMDDFTVYAKSFDACFENLSQVLCRCMEANLVLNFEKCYFMVIEGIVLGHLVSSRRIEVDTIAYLPNLAFVQEVHLFLGHVGFYRHFIKNFSKIALPLSKLLQKDVDFVFDQPCMEASQELKKRITSTLILQELNWEYPFKLMCDASNFVLGAVLGQRVGKQPHVITYASRTMDSTQINYTTTEKELLAIVFALDKFRSYLLSSKIIEFHLEVRDKKGAENVVADHLTRLRRGINPLPIRDEFPDEHILQLEKVTPWYANIYNFLVASTFPQGASRAYKEKLKVVSNTTYGIILIFGDFVMTNRSSTFFIQHLEAAIMDRVEQPRKS